MATAETAAPEKLRQSRLGKRPVPLAQGVTAKVEGSTVTIKGPKGESKRTFSDQLTITLDGGALRIVPKASAQSSDGARLQGLAWALLKNMVEGVSKGYAKSLDLVGTGYRAELKGTTLTLALGLSHPVHVALPVGIKARVETIDEGGTKKPRVHLESHDKELLGQFAAKVRSYRPPEPYKGKGVRYVGERIRQKAGKAGKGGKK
jgi:large subunit ribosomal protein L6